ncbi:class IV adenylate cyclase [Anaerolinea sp.]|uniref:class IV adenylate cyclase n=1 Tax=Anaerolinea sp. TaxID=1872519 RepID=UPI0026080EF0|nr:class IV adenylate cyclase [uncultured Anaerolinea sp.]
MEQEVEAKFPIRSLETVRKRLEQAGAVLEAPRVHEVNLRFDTPEGTLTRERRVLRLRRDSRAILTYKGAAQPGQEVSVRQEIEVEVSDFEAARRLLEALGYRVSTMYEKYRTTYRLNDAHVVLDEMPFGNFVEIEGENAEKIHAIASVLGLRWEARVAESYLGLFERVRQAYGLPPTCLTFEALRDVSVRFSIIGLEEADV